ncbi:hypothetical protein [Endozoicomonas elysicola]|uniref:Uncharacterized protein n=1 Tax=Endozoicomonas elysicola TaxID=305900 RepID=A0A081KDE5_9GAMM|nr:hypothetical protein [Endozoicomonas elysicola]KEI72171.1 hypothetical protein GV64_16835 [Endozoicomonas elysicola]
MDAVQPVNLDDGCSSQENIEPPLIQAKNSHGQTVSVANSILPVLSKNPHKGAHSHSVPTQTLSERDPRVLSDHKPLDLICWLYPLPKGNDGNSEKIKIATKLAEEFSELALDALGTLPEDEQSKVLKSMTLELSSELNNEQVITDQKRQASYTDTNLHPYEMAVVNFETELKQLKASINRLNEWFIGYESLNSTLRKKRLQQSILMVFSTVMITPGRNIFTDYTELLGARAYEDFKIVHISQSKKKRLELRLHDIRSGFSRYATQNINNISWDMLSSCLFLHYHRVGDSQTAINFLQKTSTQACDYAP